MYINYLYICLSCVATKSAAPSTKATYSTACSATSVSYYPANTSSVHAAKSTCYTLSSNTSMYTSFSFTRHSSPTSVTNYTTAYGLHAIPFWKPCWRALAFAGEVFFRFFCNIKNAINDRPIDYSDIKSISLSNYIRTHLFGGQVICFWVKWQALVNNSQSPEDSNDSLGFYKLDI